MIDRIRQDIQERLDQLLAEADRLRQALHALGGERASTTRSPRAASSTSTSRSRAGGAGRSRAAAGSSRARSRAGSSSARSRASSSSRAASGGTKNAVLKALADAKGGAMTASEVAAATGLGRASVSTTLSKLARAGDVNKADRGYRLTAAEASSDGSGS